MRDLPEPEIWSARLTTNTGKVHDITVVTTYTWLELEPGRLVPMIKSKSVKSATLDRNMCAEVQRHMLNVQRAYWIESIVERGVISLQNKRLLNLRR